MKPSLKVIVRGTKVVSELTGVLTSGMVGVPVTFQFDEGWEDLRKLAVFEGSGQKKFVDLDAVADPKIPWEVLVEPRDMLKVGVEGRDADGTIVIPTCWSEVGVILRGAQAGNDPALEPTPTVYDQIMQAIESGRLKGADGLTPYIGENGTWWLGKEDTGIKAEGKDGYTPVKGKDYFDGKAGYTPQRGVDYWTEADKKEITEDAIAPIAEYEKSANIFNPNDPGVGSGYVNSAAGGILSHATYWHSGYIPIKENKIYIFNGNSSHIAMYDSGKNYVGRPTTSMVGWVMFTSTVTGYFRFTITNKDAVATTMMIELDSEDERTNYPFAVFIPYVNEVYPKGFKELQRQVDSMAFPVSPNNTTFFENQNLANPDEFVVGKFMGNTGYIGSSADYFYTGFIPVFYGETIRFTDRARYVTAYDIDKKLLPESGVGGWVDYYEVPEGVSYVIFSFRIDYVEKLMVNAGDALLPYKPYGYKLIPEYLDLERITDLPSKSLAGSEAGTVSVDALTADTLVKIADFPENLKKGFSLSFGAKFDTFGTLLIGKGYNAYRGQWFEITSENITQISYDGSSTVVETKAHGLTISTFIQVAIDIGNDSKFSVMVNTLSGGATFEFQANNEFNGAPFVQSSVGMTNVRFGATSQDFKKPMWMFGDSYYGIADNRIIGQLKNMGYFDNVLIHGLAGTGSVASYANLEKALKYGTPKFLVWCLGMNDGDSAYTTTLGTLKALCEDKGITLILMKIPSVPDRAKENINAAIDNSGLRFIDAYSAVGSAVGGAWYDGYLSTDKVHPTDLGAKAIAMQVLVDVPEIMQYGRSGLQN